MAAALLLLTSVAALAQRASGGPFGLATFDKTPPHVGDKAPGFALQDEAGKIVKLSEFRGKSLVVLQFGAIT